MFKPLGRSDLTKIIEIQLRDLQKRLDSRDVLLEMDDRGAALVLKEAYNPAYGARPLRRWLERVVVTELSRWLIDGRLQEHSRVTISEKDGSLTFRSELLPRSETRQLLSDGPAPAKKRRAYSSLSSDSVLDDAMDCL